MNKQRKLDDIISDMTEEEANILLNLRNNKIDSKQLSELIKGKPKKYNEISIGINDKHVLFGVLSDLHIGHECYRPDILEHAVKTFNNKGVEFILIPGDVLEGNSGRDGHIFELTHIGATAQLNYGVSELSKFKQPIYGIIASNSHDGWFSGKGNMGLDIGEELQKRLKNFNYLGLDEADLKLDNKLVIRMIHPGGGTAYAYSYKIQKYVNSLSGGKKPNLIFEGHYHKLLYLMYRNIHCYEAGTLESQTKFMKKIGTSANLGYWIVDVSVGKHGGVNSVTNTLYPFYEK
jgi:hypothetical protein